MAPFVRFLLLRELAARPDDHPASWTKVFERLRDHAGDQDVCGRLHHELALGNRETVVTELAELLDELSGTEWLEYLDRIVATPGLRPRRTEPGPADTEAEPRRTAVARLVTAMHQLADPLLSNRRALSERYAVAANACERLSGSDSDPFAVRAQHLGRLATSPEAATRPSPGTHRPEPEITGDGRVYLWRIWPDPRRFPKMRRHWWRPAAVVVIFAVIAPGSVAGVPWLSDRFSCGWQPLSGVWKQDGDCVGLSEGAYAFNRPELADAMNKIAQQNEAATDGSCAPGASAVTVGALLTLTSAEGGGRSLHLLEGIAAAQHSANTNKAECVHPIRLLVAEMGAKEQAATELAELLADRGVTAVVGMGLSLQQTADAARVLGRHRIPMVGTVITAEGFDANGSQQDSPDYRGCNPAHTYKSGIGQGYFYRVAYRNAVQIEQLAKYLEPAKGTVKFIMTPTTMDDPYTCTTVPLVHATFDPKSRPLQEVRFDPGDAVTVKQSAQRICATAGEVTVFYAARAYHLPQFLKSIADQSGLGQCQFTSITVVSTSDAARMRAEEVDPNLEQQRLAALSTPLFLNGTIRLIYTPLADPDLLPDGGEMAALKQSFSDLGFETAHLNSGWAINGYDGMTTIARAVNSLTALQPATPARVKAALGSFVQGGAAAGGASGNITFDNYGNRDDSVPSVVRLCPAKGREEPRTVRVYPEEAPCP